MRDQVKGILTDIRPDVDFESNQRLIDDGILDSFDIVELAGELSDTFGIQVSVEDLQPENFNSIDAIVALVVELQQRG